MSGPTGFVIALDVGTSSVRALLFDTRGRQVPGVEVHLPYQPRVAADGTYETDAERLMARVFTAVDGVVEAAGSRRAGRVVAVGVSTFWHGIVAVEAGGRPATPLYLWADTRAWRESERLRETLDVEAIHQRTGCLIHPSYWPAKLAWLRATRPELFERPGVRFLSFWDLVHQRLFGEPVTSVSMASGTGLMDARRCRWDAGMLKLLGIDEDRLAVLGEAGQGLTGATARRWPQLKAVPWLCGSGDGALANLGSGCQDQGQRALTIGTSGALRVLYEGFPKRIPRGLWAYRLDRRRTVVGGALSNGGNLFAWLTTTLAIDRRQLETALRRMRPAGTGLAFLPLLAGERSPGWASHATGAIAGLTHATTPVDIVRAGLESVAIEFRRVDELLDKALPGAHRLVANGAGLLASPAWMQIMADVIGKPVAASRAGEASSRGAALQALEHTGHLRLEALEAEVGRVYRPDPEHTARYEVETRRQEALYKVLITDRLLDKVNLSGPQAAAGGNR